jgi:hypothetical protein
VCVGVQCARVNILQLSRHSPVLRANPSMGLDPRVLLAAGKKNKAGSLWGRKQERMVDWGEADPCLSRGLIVAENETAWGPVIGATLDLLHSTWSQIAANRAAHVLVCGQRAPSRSRGRMAEQHRDRKKFTRHGS